MDSSEFLDHKQLHAVATEGMTKAWNTLRSTYENEQVYGFGFFTYDLGSITTTAYTNQGLEEVATEYMKRAASHNKAHPDGLPHYKLDLRWSPADSPRHEIGGQHLMAATTTLMEAETALDEHYGLGHEISDEAFEIKLVAHNAVVSASRDVLVDVLNELDAEGLFGTNRTLILGIWEGDQSDEDRVAFVRRCNPPELADRFHAEQVAAFAAFLKRQQQN